MRLLVTGAWNAAEEQLNILRQRHEVRIQQQESAPLVCEPDWVEGVICNGLFQHHPIEQFVNLRHIQLTSAGFDRVPMAYVREKGIEIHNARGVYSAPMAEFAVCGVLQLYKQAAYFRDNQRQHSWQKHRGLRELSGKTVCIVGCGSVGMACAKRFGAFDTRVIGVDLLPDPKPHIEQLYPLDQLEAALRQSDVVILTTPLTCETVHLMNEIRLGQMKPGAVLVNLSRGALVKTAALVEALQTEALSGAVLDVFETEPLPSDSPLWDMENVLITPHNSFVGEGNGERLFFVIEKNMGNY